MLKVCPGSSGVGCVSAHKEMPENIWCFKFCGMEAGSQTQKIIKVLVEKRLRWWNLFNPICLELRKWGKKVHSVYLGLAQLMKGANGLAQWSFAVLLAESSNFTLRWGFCWRHGEQIRQDGKQKSTVVALRNGLQNWLCRLSVWRMRLFSCQMFPENVLIFYGLSNSNGVQTPHHG